MGIQTIKNYPEFMFLLEFGNREEGRVKGGGEEMFHIF